MKIFNLDYHTSVVADLEMTFKGLGHSIDSHVLGNEMRKFPYKKSDGPYHGLTIKNFWDWIPERFHEEHKERLSGYDAFLVTYPPAFSLLYNRFDQPIICVLPIRFDYSVSNDPVLFSTLIEWFIKKYDEKRVIVVANNAYDQKYFEYFTGIKPILIESLCRYAHGRYEPTDWRSILMDTRSRLIDTYVRENVIGVQPLRDVYRRYRYDHLGRHKALVWIPYNSSIMSFFENYWMGIPIFCPTPEFLVKLAASKDALAEISFYKTGGMNPGSLVYGMLEDEMYDPNDYKSVAALLEWTKYYDFYRFPHVTYFDSWGELTDKLNNINLGTIHINMSAENVERRLDVENAWKGVFCELEHRKA